MITREGEIMANLKNYTSMANPLKTAAEIEAILIINGLSQFRKIVSAVKL